MIAEQMLRAIGLLTRTACHYLHSVPHGIWSHFFFIHNSKVYSDSVGFIYLKGSISFFFFFFFLRFCVLVKLLPVIQMKSCETSLKTVAYILNTNPLRCSVTTFFHFAIEKTKVLLLLFSAFSLLKHVLTLAL